MKKNLRFIVQVAFFIFVALVVLNHNLAESGQEISWIPGISLHAICPFGGVETLYSLVFLKTYIAKIHASALILFVLIMFISVLFGPVFCGYFCPLGSIQEWFGKLGKKIFKGKYNHFIPKKIDQKLRYMRYIVLIGVLYFTIKSLTLAFLVIDPFHALFNFYTGEAAIGGLTLLVITLVGSIFIERPWCKYLCPYGAILGLFNLFRLFPVKRKTKTCINCKVCDTVCPMNIPVSEKITIRDHQCISCYECLSDKSCPVSDTVVIESLIRKVDKDE